MGEAARLLPTMRWFGPTRDTVSLAQIKQAGAVGVVTALHEIPCGEVWPIQAIQNRRDMIRASGLEWSVVESVPIHEAIKQGSADRHRFIENYCQTLRHLAREGIRTVCYNFMAVTDWTRTDFEMRMPDGSTALRFDAIDAACFDLFCLERRGAEDDYSTETLLEAESRVRTGWDRERICRNILMGLPGTVDNLSVDQFKNIHEKYYDIGEEDLRRNLVEFLGEVIPVAEEEGIQLAIHPDDPPFPIFGLPRVAGTESQLGQILDAVDSPSNGITFCSGSLGARADNDLPAILRRFGTRVFFAHLRSVRREADGSFFEDDHLAGSANMVEVMHELIQISDRRKEPLSFRPDHGHLLEGDVAGAHAYPGYSFFGRMKGLAELRGLELGLRGASDQGFR